MYLQGKLSLTEKFCMALPSVLKRLRQHLGFRRQVLGINGNGMVTHQPRFQGNVLYKSPN